MPRLCGVQLLALLQELRHGSDLLAPSLSQEFLMAASMAITRASAIARLHESSPISAGRRGGSASMFTS